MMLLIFLPALCLFKYLARALRYLAETLKLFKKQRGVSKDWILTESVDENIGNYWNCVPGMKQMKMFANETHQRANLNIRTMGVRSYEKVKTGKRNKKRIFNEISYDILENEIYASKFFYQHLGQRVENQSSDFVTSALYLGEESL